MTTRATILHACSTGNHRKCFREGRLILPTGRVRTICRCECHRDQPALPALSR